jgi:two-component system, cell cycle response regulator
MSSYRDGPPTAISVPPERPKPAPLPYLLFLSGRDVGRSVKLSAEAVDIGRSDECAVSVNSDGVSRRHARLQRIFGLYFVTDLESTNGTYVNEQRVAMMQLNDGDQIRVGDAVLKFVLNHLEVEYNLQVSTLASADALTGALGKHHFEQAWEKEVERSTRNRSPLSLILFDLDHFKLVNDTYGHAAGDAVLSRTAAVVRGLLASESIFGRVGGEEFAIAVANTPLASARDLAERIRRAVEQTVYDHLGRTIAVTLSLGVAELAAGESAEQVYVRADERLYAAKRAGRNRVA